VKTIAYIDGFNLYYGSVKNTGFKWLDLAALFHLTLPAGYTLAKVKYFTARVSALPHDPGAPKRQDVYLRALRAHLKGDIEIIEGHFSVKNVWAPLTANPAKFAEVIKTEEKGSDVNLAVQLVHDAWDNQFDCAAVVSNDADLCRALKIVKQYRKKRVLLYTPGTPTRRPLAVLKQWSHKQIDITTDILRRAQLPNPIPGTALAKPARW
jgi:uncharacterized LabA/DUF88 family protein